MTKPDCWTLAGSTAFWARYGITLATVTYTMEDGLLTERERP